MTVVVVVVVVDLVKDDCNGNVEAEDRNSHRDYPALHQLHDDDDDDDRYEHEDDETQRIPEKKMPLVRCARSVHLRWERDCSIRGASAAAVATGTVRMKVACWCQEKRDGIVGSNVMIRMTCEKCKRRSYLSSFLQSNSRRAKRDPQ